MSLGYKRNILFLNCLMVLYPQLMLVGCQVALEDHPVIVEPEPPAGSLSGLVIDAFTNQALGNAEIRIPVISVIALTDEDGFFLIYDIPAGTYLAHFNLPDFTSDSLEIIIGSDDSLFIETRLIREDLWTEVYPSSAGSRYSFRLMPNGEIMAICGGNILHSQNDGISWELVETPSGIFDIELDSKGDLIAGGYGHGAPIYRSTDHGATWETTLLTDISSVVLGIDITIGPGDTIFAALEDNLLRSDNDGLDWQNLSYLNGIHDDAVFTSANRMFYAGGDYGIYASDDLGDTWENVRSGLDFYIADILLTSDEVMILGTNHGVFRYHVSERSLENIYSQLVTNIYGNVSYPAVVELLNTEDDRLIGGLHVQSTSVTILIMSPNGVWNDISSNIPPATVQELTLSKDGYVLVGLKENGIYRSSVPLY